MKKGINQANAIKWTNVKLKDGSLCETSKEEVEGFKWLKDVADNGTDYSTWIKRHSSIVGHITEVRRNKYEQNDGKIIKSWKVFLDVGEIPNTEMACFTVFLGDNRNVNRLLTLICNVNFEELVKIHCFKGKQGNTVLMMSQKDENDDVKAITPKYVMKWLRFDLHNKIKKSIKDKKDVKFTEEDKENLKKLNWKTDKPKTPVWKHVDMEYPYVTQKKDPESPNEFIWVFDEWSLWLNETFDEHLHPIIIECQQERDSANEVISENVDDASDILSENDGADSADSAELNDEESEEEMSEEDIPF